MKRKETETAFKIAHTAVQRWVDRVDLQDINTRLLLGNIDTNELLKQTDTVVSEALAQVQDRRSNATLPMMMRGYAVAAAQELAIGRDKDEVTKTFAQRLKENLEQIPVQGKPQAQR